MSQIDTGEGMLLCAYPYLGWSLDAVRITTVWGAAHSRPLLLGFRPASVCGIVNYLLLTSDNATYWSLLDSVHQSVVSRLPETLKRSTKEGVG